MSHPVLTTARLTLTPVALTDFDDLCALWRDEGFTRHITGRPLPEEDVWSRLLRDIGHWSVLGRGNWTMRMSDGGAYAGSVGVIDYHRNVEPALTSPELGWGLAPTFQGLGLAAEGVAAALDWADQVLRAPRTVCMIGPANLASLRLAGRVGYAPFAETVYRDGPVILLERNAPSTLG